MKVVQAPPPNYIAISDKFHLATLEGFNPVFTYGDTIYNPTGLPISQDLMIHEEVHEKQQAKWGIEQWWSLYLESNKFRLDQEVEAYKAQYQFLKTVFNRKGRLIALNQLAENISSALYGNLLTKKQAKELIDG